MMLSPQVKNRLVNSLAIFIIFIGFFVRLYVYLLDRSLWRDEAHLANIIVKKSFMNLIIEPLSSTQAAPVGFVLLEKSAITFIQNNDYMMRLVPLLAGLGSILLIYYITKKYTTGLTPFITTGLFAILLNLISYSAQVKQYSSDVFVGLLILLCAINTLENTEKQIKSTIILGIVCTVGIWFSHPSLFITSGVLLALGLYFIKQKNKHQILYIIGIGIVFSISLVIMYLVSLKDIAANTILLRYWKNAFAPIPTWENLSWYKNTFMTGILTDLLTIPSTIITIFILVVGIFSFGFKRWPLLIMLIAPFFLALIASSLHKYPFSGRLLLFLIPMLLMLVAEGIEHLNTMLLKINKPLAFIVTSALLLYLFYTPTLNSYKQIRYFEANGDYIQPIMAHLKQNRLSNDLIYVFLGASKSFIYYAPFYQIERESYTTILSDKLPNSLIGKPRVWFVFSDFKIRKTQKKEIFKYLRQHGIQKDSLISTTSELYLYDMTQKP